MLPESLLSSYRQYKSDTDSIGNWLVTTAKRYGYSADLLIESKSSIEQDAQPSTRLKGKARKAARDKTATDTSSNDIRPCWQRIHTPLAQHIASKTKDLIQKARPSQPPLIEPYV